MPKPAANTERKRQTRDRPHVKTNLSDAQPRVSQRPKTRVVSRRNNKSVFLKSVFRADVCRRPLPVFICGCRDRVSTAPRIHGNGNGNGNLRVCVRASVVSGALSMNGKIRQDVFLYERRIRWIFFFQGGKNLFIK